MSFRYWLSSWITKEIPTNQVYRLHRINHRLQNRALDKEAMARLLVDGKGMSAVAKEEDYKLFDYTSPDPDADTVIQPGKKDSDKQQMEKIVADAHESIGRKLIARIRGMDQVLSEDAGMKVNKKSRTNVRKFHSSLPFRQCQLYPCCPLCRIVIFRPCQSVPKDMVCCIYAASADASAWTDQEERCGTAARPGP